MAFQALELLSGHGNVSAVFRELGFPTVSYDLKLGGRSMDFCQPAGFAFETQATKVLMISTSMGRFHVSKAGCICLHVSRTDLKNYFVIPVPHRESF